jgi:hypothetical protein
MSYYGIPVGDETAVIPTLKPFSYNGTKSVSSSYTLQISDYGKVINITAANVVLTLPVSSTTPGYVAFNIIFTAASGSSSVVVSGTDTIQNQTSSVTSISFNPGDSIELVSTTAGSWWNISSTTESVSVNLSNNTDPTKGSALVGFYPGSNVYAELNSLAAAVNDISVARTKQNIPATSTNQVNFTVPGGYQLGGLDVFMYNTYLVEGTDYTATDGSTVHLINPKIYNTVQIGDAMTVSSLTSYATIENPVSSTSLASSGGATMVGYNSQTVAEALNTLNQVRTKYSIAATAANQTVFTVPNGYNIGTLECFMYNAYLIEGTDYVATNGTSITILNTHIINKVAIGDVLVVTALIAYAEGQNNVNQVALASSGGAGMVGYGTTTVAQALNGTIVNRQQQYYTGLTTNVVTVTGGYTPGAIEVYLNGSKIPFASGLYQATDGATVVFQHNLNSTDVVELMINTAFSYNNGVNASQLASSQAGLGANMVGYSAGGTVAEALNALLGSPTFVQGTTTSKNQTVLPVTGGYTVGTIRGVITGLGLSLQQADFTALDGQNVTIINPAITLPIGTTYTVEFYTPYVALQDQITTSVEAAAGSAAAASTSAAQAASSAASSSVATIANGTATNAGTLTGAEITPLSRGSGLLQTTYSTIAQWVLQIFQGFTRTATGAVAQTVQGALQFVTPPENFGAVGNGTTDDSAAFTAFQTWAKTLPSGATAVLDCTAGKTYTFALPYWPFGIKKLIVNGNGCSFLCTSTNSNDEACIWTCPGPQLGTPGLSYQPVLFELINSTSVGQTQVTLLTPSAASNFSVGETIMVASYDMLYSGQPPCFKFFEYPIITGVNTTTGILTLDRTLKYNHLATFPYLATLPYWSGMASIYKVEQAAPWNITHVFNDITFSHKTNASAYLYCTGRSVTFNRCTAAQWLPTAVGHLSLNECTQTYGNVEFDKLNEIIEINGGVWPANIFASFSTNELRFTNTKLLQGYTVAPKKLIFDNVQVNGTGLSQTQLSGYGTVEYLSVKGGEHYQAPRIGVTGSQITLGSNGVTFANDVITIPINTAVINQFATQADIGRVIEVVTNDAGTYIGTGNFATITNITGDGVNVLITIQQNTPFAGTESLNIWQEPTSTSIEGVEIAGSLQTLNQNYVTICRNRFSFKNLLLPQGYSLNQPCDGTPKRIKVTVLRAYTGSTTGNVTLNISELGPSYGVHLKIDLRTVGVREQTFYGSIGLSGSNGETAPAALSNANYWSYLNVAGPTTLLSTSNDQLPIVSVDVVFENDMYPANIGD